MDKVKRLLGQCGKSKNEMMMMTKKVIMTLLMMTKSTMTLVMMFVTLATRVPALCLQSLRPEREKYLKRRTCEISII